MTAARYTSVTVLRDQAMRTRDGVVLRADIWRPVAGGRFPVLLLRTPYDKTQASTINYAHPAWYARRGYIVALSGRARSMGVGRRVHALRARASRRP